MKKEERIFNVTLGASVFYWGILGLYIVFFDDKFSIVRFLSSILNLVIGGLIILRNPIKNSGSVFAQLLCVPSIIIGGFFFKFSLPFYLWPNSCEIIFLVGALIVIISFLFLGKNFSILPNLRSIVINGPYNIVRHPGYFGEILIIISCFLSNFDFLHSILLVVFFVFLIFRIGQEEKLLSQNWDYVIYKSRVKWRLIPFLW